MKSNLFVCYLFFFCAFTVEASVLPHQSDKATGIDFYEIKPDEDRGSLVLESDFYEIIENVYALYKNQNLMPERKIIVKQKDWENSYIAVWTHDETNDIYSINFWGGFARLPHMTTGSFALVCCHEIGHVLGGEPYFGIDKFQNLTSEGQADYFATATCLKQYNRKYGLPDARGVDTYAASQCFEKYQGRDLEMDECFKIAKAVQELSRVIAFVHHKEVPHFTTPSQEIVEKTILNGYPSVQCRMDTMLSGALAEVEEDNRPSCWFKK